MNRIISAVLLFLGLGVAISAQTAPAPSTPPVQHFIISGSASGQPAALASAGFQLTSSISLAYEYIQNPNDHTRPRVGSGVANYTVQAASFLPKSLKSKLLIDPTNYLVTFQGGVGRESLPGATPSANRITHMVGNFGIYGGKQLSDHTQIGFGYKWIIGPQGQGIKVPVGNLNFTF